MNSVYIFEPKNDYKYAYYVFKINKFLVELNDKMIKDDNMKNYMTKYSI